MYKGFVRLSIDRLFERDVNIKGTRGHTLRLKKKRSVRDVRRYFFSQRVVKRWNSLDQETVDAGSINSFKGRLDKIRKTRMGFLWILHGPQSPGPHEDRTPVRPHKMSHKVNQFLPNVTYKGMCKKMVRQRQKDGKVSNTGRENGWIFRQDSLCLPSSQTKIPTSLDTWRCSAVTLWTTGS